MAIKPEYGNSQDLVEIEQIREDVIIMKDGSLRQILMVGGTNLSLKSDEEQSVIIATYQNFLNSLEFPIQIAIHSRKININDYLGVLDKRLGLEQSPLLQNQITEYKEFVKSFVQENAIMTKIFLITIPFVPVSVEAAKESLIKALPIESIPFISKRGRGGKKEEAAREKSTKEKEEAFQEHVSQLKQRVNQVIEDLGTVGLDVVTLNKEQLIELFYNFYNPETVERKKTAATN